ncbi:LAQU0S05e05248g1_1 [Lachancea quebecensis]|uniref:LAQU0S05e05248g1_1 n=1 Tax=Lachancea quebecensis TaxID=1654605 RepID=A0A0P1KQS2_9SACH|nr:LAQU0S05e05248g1_1 [Lachancea quebecensis]
MDSDLSSVGSEDDIYEDTPEVAEEELIGSEPEDDEYQYTPDDYEEDEEAGQRSKTGSRSSRQATTNEPRASNRKRASTDEFEEPGSSPAKRARRNGAIDLQNLDDDDEEDDDDTSSASHQKLNSRNKMISELMDNTSRRSSKLTDQELQLRRAENARKRKNLSEKKLEEEKQDTINKLLRRRAGKSRTAVPATQEQEDDDAADYVKPRRAYNAHGLVRTLRTKDTDIYATY